jgi:AcrR family transcriptional regulator
MTTKSYKEQERQRREQAIVFTACKMLRESATVDLKMDDLAEAVGISKPTLYAHFKNKDELVSRVLAVCLERFAEHLMEPHTQSPLDWLVYSMRLLMQHRYDPEGLLINFGTEVILRLLDSDVELLAQKRSVLQILESLVDDAKARNEINTGLPTHMIVHTIFALLGMVQRDLPNDPEAAKAIMERQIEAMIALLLYGITPRTPCAEIEQSNLPERNSQ